MAATSLLAACGSTPSECYLTDSLTAGGAAHLADLDNSCANGIALVAETPGGGFVAEVGGSGCHLTTAEEAAFTAALASVNAAEPEGGKRRLPCRVSEIVHAP